jgi:hypothetical protein
MSRLKLFITILAALTAAPRLAHSALVPADKAELGAAANYIQNGGCEHGTAGWKVYADAAGASPVDGTGGSPVVSISASTTNPLEGKASCVLTKTAANDQGNGWAYDFTIGRAQLTKRLQVSFDYEVASGTYDPGSDTTDSDITAWVYGPTDGTPVMTQLAPYKVLGGGTQLRFQGQMQTAASGVAYRLILHEAKTGTSAFTLKLDNLTVGPDPKSYGPPVTDWQSYTPTFTGFGAVSGVAVYSRRVGDTLQIRGSFLAGTVAASTATLTIGYNGFNGNVSSVVDGAVAGFWAGNGGTLTGKAGGFYLPNSGTVGFLGNGYAAVNGSDVAGSSQTVGFFIQMQISGWGSSVVMSSDSETRIVAAGLQGNPASATAGNPIIFPTATYDTHGAYNTTTGRFTAPVPGYYRVFGYLSTAAANTIIRAYVNGVQGPDIGVTQANFSGNFTGTVKVNGGDLIDIRPSGTCDADGTSVLFIERVSGPSQIAASETISLQVGKTTAQSVANSSFADITSWDAPTVDDHLAFNASTGVYTVPSAGKYLVSATAAFASNSTGFRVTKIYQNGSTVRELSVAAISNDGGAAVTAILNCAAGDLIKIGAFQNSGGALNTSTASGYTSLSIVRQ